MDQQAGIGIFQHPQRAVRGFLHIADAMADIPAFRGFGAAMAIEDDPVQSVGGQSADEAVAVPLGKSLCAVVEHQIAGRDHGEPIQRGLCQIGPGIRFGDRHAVVILAIGNERPAVVLALFDQVELVASARAVLDFP